MMWLFRGDNKGLATTGAAIAPARSEPKWEQGTASTADKTLKAHYSTTSVADMIIPLYSSASITSSL